jgi:hypothetical protein
LIILIIIGEECKLWNSSLCSFFPTSCHFISLRSKYFVDTHVEKFSPGRHFEAQTNNFAAIANTEASSLLFSNEDLYSTAENVWSDVRRRFGIQLNMSGKS